MPAPRLDFVAPVLPSKDVGALMTWYVERLGFRLTFRDDPAVTRYAAIRRDGVELHLQWHDPAEWIPGLDRPMVRIVLEDVAGLFREYESKGVFHDRTALRKTAWRTEEFAFYDPDGNGLVFMRDLREGE